MLKEKEIYRDAGESVEKDLRFLGLGYSGIGSVVKLVFDGVRWKVFGWGSESGLEGESGESKREIGVEAERE